MSCKDAFIKEKSVGWSGLSAGARAAPAIAALAQVKS